MKDCTLDLYSYVDYRAYLKDYFAFRKSQCPSFSIENFSRRCPNLGRSHLSLIISGKRNLGPNKIASLAVGLRLTKNQIKYFEALVKYCQSKNEEEKISYLAEFVRIRRPSHNLELDQNSLLQSWIPIAVIELARLPGFRAEPSWIVSRLRQNVNEAEIAQVLKMLFKLKILCINNKGEISPKEKIFSTTDELKSHAIQNYHKSCLDLAACSLVRDDVADREFDSITFPLSEEKFIQLKQKIKDFILETLESTQTNKSHIGQLNIQLFKLTKNNGG